MGTIFTWALRCALVYALFYILPLPARLALVDAWGGFVQAVSPVLFG